MTGPCQELEPLIADAVDGTLDADRRRHLEVHLATCTACRDTLAALGAIRAAAASLPPLPAPPRVWPALDARLARERTSASRVRTRWRGSWLPMAAALALAVTGAVWSIGPRPPASVADTGGWTDEVEAGYGEAIAQLEDLRRASDVQLDRQVAGPIDASLAVVDRAIAESRSALRSNAADDAVRDGLRDALADKVALLERAVQLIEDRRSGDGDGDAEVEASPPQ